MIQHMKKLIFLIFTLTLIQSSLTAGFVHRIKHIRGTEDDHFESIFQNATIQKTQTQYKLYLSDRVVRLLNVPDVMQATDYTCGPTSLLAVLSYYQVAEDFRESDLAKLAKTTQDAGTMPQYLYGAIRTLGFSAQMKQQMTISDLQNNIKSNQPIIILFQAWADQGTKYKDDFSDGHYVVVIGYDNDYLYFEDPWILGSIGYIPKSQFLDRWHGNGITKRVYNLGIVVKTNQIPKPVVIKLE